MCCLVLSTPANTRHAIAPAKPHPTLFMSAQPKRNYRAADTGSIATSGRDDNWETGKPTPNATDARPIQRRAITAPRNNAGRAERNNRIITRSRWSWSAGATNGDASARMPAVIQRLTPPRRQPTTRTVNDILNLRLSLRALLAGAAVGF
jgi:hypothetical protein